MSYTKRQYAESAYNELVLAGYVFDISPEMMISAVRTLDSMVDSWNGAGINIQWPTSGTYDPDMDVSCPVPASAVLAIVKNLAIAVANSFGKMIPVSLASGAKMAYDNMLVNRTACIPVQCLPGTMPVGAGNKQWGSQSYPFFGSYNYGARSAMASFEAP